MNPKKRIKRGVTDQEREQLQKEVQDPQHIIPEDSKMDWVRGGLPTRQMVRNKDYLRRCQEKTMMPVQ